MTIEMSTLLTPRDLATLADSAEALAFADFFAAAPDGVRSRLGLRVELQADATLLLAPGFATPILNRAIGLGLQRTATPETVDAITARFAAAGSTTWWLHWNPLAQPMDLPSMLAAKGFGLDGPSQWAKMQRGTEPPPAFESELTVDIAAATQVDAVSQVFAQAFGMPSFMADWLRALHGRADWTVYAVMDGSRVVGGGCRYQRGQVAWLGMGSMAESHRRRGGQAVLMSRRIADALAMGARRIFTETGEPLLEDSNPSLNNMKRCGFSKIVSRLNLGNPAAPQLA